MFDQAIESANQAKQVEQLFYSPAQLAKLLGIGTTKLYELFKVESFPKPTTNPYFKNKYNKNDVLNWLYQNQDAA